MLNVGVFVIRHLTAERSEFFGLSADVKALRGHSSIDSAVVP